MTTVIFVHGTGGRESNYTETFEKIKQSLQAQRPDIEVVPCIWGDSLGAKLKANGASIPAYDTISNDKAIDRVAIEEVIDRGKKEDQASIPYTEALQNITNETIEDYYTLAKTIVTEVRELAKMPNKYATVLSDPTLRDELVGLINKELANRVTYPAGAIDEWVKKQLFGMAADFGTNYLKQKRNELTDLAYPATGDILLYQGRQGNQIREFIYNLIQQSQPPVVLLAHSLGGIACVDLLVEMAVPHVSLLITVGSQAPFLYEINALSSLEYSEPLPEHFPKWLNIYDHCDFLSYIGGKIFPNKVQDISVDNKQPFPESHSSYWDNAETWNAVLAQIP